MDCNPPGSSVRWVSQARMLEWVAISFSRGSSWPRDWIWVSCIGRQVLYHWVTMEALGAAQSPDEMRNQSKQTKAQVFTCPSMSFQPQPPPQSVESHQRSWPPAKAAAPWNSEMKPGRHTGSVPTRREWLRQSVSLCPWAHFFFSKCLWLFCRAYYQAENMYPQGNLNSLTKIIRCLRSTTVIKDSKSSSICHLKQNDWSRWTKILK